MVLCTPTCSRVPSACFVIPMGLLWPPSVTTFLLGVLSLSPALSPPELGPHVPLPSRRRVKVAVALLTQQANTPKSASCVRLTCRTVARRCSEAFWPNLEREGAPVGWATQTDRQADVPWGRLLTKWCLGCSRCPATARLWSRRRQARSAQWPPSARCSSGLSGSPAPAPVSHWQQAQEVQEARCKGLGAQWEGSFRGESHQGYTFQQRGKHDSPVASPAPPEKQAQPPGSGSKHRLQLRCSRLGRFLGLGQPLTHPRSNKQDLCHAQGARGPPQLKKCEMFHFAAYLPWLGEISCWHCWRATRGRRAPAACCLLGGAKFSCRCHHCRGADWGWER